ncbi:hypothetical protein MMC07_007108 [Pseudocyphellaria aurata]|nr:hypothetical protein [Pseudocyphellaria aurata]
MSSTNQPFLTAAEVCFNLDAIFLPRTFPVKHFNALTLFVLLTGAGNVLPDDTPYVDGEITREGYVGEGDGAFSAGYDVKRGGAGNIESPGLKPTNKTPADAEVVPEVALRPSTENYHVGRGGEGNVHKESPPPPTVHEGLADKLKHKFLGKKKDPAK